MKKVISVVLSVIMMLNIGLFTVYAENDERIISDAENEAGFCFDSVHVKIKNEYSFDDFTPEKFGSELIGEIESPYPFRPENENYDKDTWELYLIVYLKEEARTKENVLELYKTLKKSEYVQSAFLNYTENDFPVYPDSPDEIGVFRGVYRPGIDPDNEKYIEKGSSMIYNSYYKNCYNGLLEHSVAIYNQFAPYMGDVDYVSWYVNNHMQKEVNYVTVILEEPQDLTTDVKAVSEYIKSVITEHIPEEYVLYVADTVFAAVLEVNEEYKAVIPEMDEIVFISDAFFTKQYGGMLAVVGSYTLGNVEGRESQIYYDDPALNVPLKRVSASDARIVLRYAAGIEKPETNLKRFYYCADMNFDGEINSADARLILRTAAGLEKEYVITFGYSDYWYDITGDIVMLV